MEMPPEASYIGLHHLPTHHMRIIAAVAVKQCLLLLCNRCVVRLVEPLLDQVDNLLALVFRQYHLWSRRVQQTCDCHWVLWILREVTTKVNLICEVRLILVLGIRITRCEC